jgi:hypothetical protein
VSMTQEAGEKVLFFRMDQKPVRDSLGINKDDKICDGLVFYCRGNEKTCCFVELKGSKVNTAIEQVTHTFGRFKEEIQSSLLRMNCQSLLKQISWKAYVCSHGNVPRVVKEYEKPLEGTFGRDNYYIGSNSDLGVFLRGEIKKHTKPSER